MRKNSKTPKFDAPIIVPHFYDPKDSKKIHPQLLKLKTYIARIAVHGFDEAGLVKYFEPEHFYRATITYIKRGNKIIGFFIACYLKKTDAKGKAYYEGKGFPGIAPEFRTGNTAKEKPSLFKQIWEKLFLNFVKFYANEIVYENLKQHQLTTKDLSLLVKPPKGIFRIGRLIQTGYKVYKFIDSVVTTRLTIYTLTENPIMYASLMNFEFNGPKPSQAEKKLLKTWDSETLLIESYRQSKNPNQNPYLKRIQDEKLTDEKDINIVVNMTPAEWRRFFEKGKNKNFYEHIKYFVWQNFRFPNYAFEIHLPVNLPNIVKGLIHQVSRMLTPKSD